MDELDLDLGDSPLDITFDPSTGKVLDTAHVIEQLYAIMARFDVAMVTAGELFVILEHVGRDILPDVTTEQWRLLATSAVALKLRAVRERQAEG